LDENRDYSVDSELVWPYNYTGYLVMNPTGAFPQDVVSVWHPVDDSTFTPLDVEPMLSPVAQTIVLNFNFCRDVNNLPRACFNNQPYIMQEVPTLFSVSSTGTDNTNPAIYGDVNPFIFNYGDVIQVVVNNLDAAIHPFHMHGHQFQVLSRPSSNEGTWSGHNRSFSAVPTRRDTLGVFGGSYAVLRIKVTNPGVFLFHCHIEWHVEMGLTATFIEAPDRLRNFTFPQDHLAVCASQGTPTAGNAAGNTQDPLNTSGFNTVPPATYTGALYQPTSAPKLKPRHVRKKL